MAGNTKLMGAASGAMSGASMGSAGGPWGAAAGGVAGGIMGLLGAGEADDTANNQMQIAANQMQNAQNEQGYSHLLTAEAMKRASAGSVDAQGNTIRYDPGSNSWVSTMGTMPAAVQASQDQANLLHNRVDVPQMSANNIASSVMASQNRSGVSGAVNAYNSYVPETSASLEGALQDASTRANRATQDPIIADTLRQFARSGSAAGPVLSQLERTNADTLSREMDQNVINAKSGVGQINANNRAALAGPVATLMGAGTPNTQNTTAAGDSPAAQLAAQVNGRAAASSSPASQGAYSNAFATGQQNAAGKLGYESSSNSPMAGILSSFGQNAQSLKKSGAFDGLGDKINGLFGPGDSSGYDPSLYGAVAGAPGSWGPSLNAPAKLPNNPSAPTYNMWTD